MNDKNISLKEIEDIIDNDFVNSTYKFALCKSAIEISYNHAEKAFLDCDGNRVIFPFSYIIAYFIRYYYPIFGHSSYIPQLQSESQKNTNSSQSAFRSEFVPIIDYYSEQGGFTALWDDIRNDTIPLVIRSEWNTFCKKIHVTIMTQPMKFFGRKYRKTLYSVFKPESEFINGEIFEGFPGCSVKDSFFSFPLKYHQIFMDRSNSYYLKEKIHRRWCSFTMSLIKDSDLTSEQFMDILSKSNQETSSISESKKDNTFSEVPPSANISVINHSLSKEGADRECDILSRSPEELILSLQETVKTSYESLIYAKKERTEAEKECSNLASEIESTETESQILHNHYGLKNPSNPIFLTHLINQKEKLHGELSTIEFEKKQKTKDLNQKIERLEAEKQRLECSRESRAQKATELENLFGEIAQLNEEKKCLENHLSGRHPAFGYVAKPIKRFLTHCDEIAFDFLLQSIHLYLTKKEPLSENNTTETLPEWFVSVFEKWWAEKQKTLRKTRTSGGKASRYPALMMDSGHHEFTLMIPAQHIQSKRPLDEVTIVVHSNSEILYEVAHPLYYDSGGYSSEEFFIPVSVPSDRYYVEMISPDSSIRFPSIELFSEQKKYACFDYETGRLLNNGADTPDKSFYVIFSEPIAIQPDNAIIESGRFYGSWYGYSYYFVDPQYAEKAGVTIGIAAEISEKNTLRYPAVSLENYHLLDKVRINNKTVISGSPPTLVLALPSPEDLLGYRLSIHPLSPGTLSETQLYSFEEFKDHCILAESDRVCRFNLADKMFFGENPIGTFAVRIRNDLKNLDQIFEFSIIPETSFSFSKSLYLPGDDNDSVELTITSSKPLSLSADESIACKRTNESWILSGPLRQEITGTLELAIAENESFSGSFSMPVPHLSWRFENSEKEIICPIQRTKVTVSDDIYDELGDGKMLTIFMPEGYQGIGTITVKPSEQYITKETQNGKIIFLISRFNDILQEIQDNQISFIFSFDSQKIRFEIPLFNLKRWRISEFDSQVTIEGDIRTMNLSWKEEGDVLDRSLIIWKAGLEHGQPQKMAEVPISPDGRTLSISKPKNKISPGLYYAQFTRIRDEWTSMTVAFPGEHASNLFQFSFDLEAPELLREGDELLTSGHYFEAIEHYKELERFNSHLVGLWKQKLQNTFMYTYRYDEILSIFKELMATTDNLRDTDYSYITFRVNDCLKNSDKFTYETFRSLFQVVAVLSKRSTPRTILLEHIPDFEQAIKLCLVLDDQQISRINRWLEKVKHSLGYKKPNVRNNKPGNR